MYNCSEGNDHVLSKGMMALKMTEDQDAHQHDLTSISPDVQKIILSHLDCDDLLHMRSTSVYYRDKISKDCQDIWDSRIAAIWPNGKGTIDGKTADEFMRWSRENNFNVHKTNADIAGYEEFVRRKRLDLSVLGRLEQLDVSPKFSVRTSFSMRPILGLIESRENTNWISLMEDGSDIVDYLKRIILEFDNNWKNSDSVFVFEEHYKQSLKESLETSRLFTENYTSTLTDDNSYFDRFFPYIEHGQDVEFCRMSFAAEEKWIKSIIVKSKIVLNAIYRMNSFQHWKYLSTDEGGHHPIEIGASVCAKFCLTIKNLRTHSWQSAGVPSAIQGEDPYLFASIDDVIEESLSKLSKDIKNSLENRIGVTGNFPLMEVIHEVNCIFGGDSPDKFCGNTEDYYDVDNSLLHEVLTRKTGIPISLAVVYCAVVRRVCGVHLDIIGLPGHIVIGLPFEEGAQESDRMFIDAFDGGKFISRSDLKSIVARYGIPWRDDMTVPLPNKDILRRMVGNLLNSDLCHGNSGARQVLTLQTLISPHLVDTLNDLIERPGFSSYMS